MTVYVDRAKNKYGRMVMSHMMADTTDELLAMAESIGVDQKYIQSAGTTSEHFDVSQTKRAVAISNGAQVVETRALVAIIVSRRIEWPKHTSQSTVHAAK